MDSIFKDTKASKGTHTFENDLIASVQNIRFRQTRNHFLKKIQKDIQLIKSSDKTVTLGNKTTNLN